MIVFEYHSEISAISYGTILLTGGAIAILIGEIRVMTRVVLLLLLHTAAECDIAVMGVNAEHGEVVRLVGVGQEMTEQWPEITQLDHVIVVWR